MFVEAAAFTPLGHNRQVVLCHVPHEEQDVHMPCFARGDRRKKALNLQLLQNRDLLYFPTDAGSCVSLTPPCLQSGWLAKQTCKIADH